MLLIDSHCHLDKLNYKSIHKNISDVLTKARKLNIKLILSVATSLINFDEMISIAKKETNVLLSCGIHPLELMNFNESDSLSKLEHFAKEKNVIAIGETGLDYYHSKNNKIKQQKIFKDHIRIAKNTNKPIIVHTRNASKDTLKILQYEQANLCRGVVHCFNEDKDIAKKILDLGFYISLSGIITFHNSCTLLEAIKYVPIDRILIETDAPYLTPVPKRGKENQPAYLYYIAKCLADIKKITLEDCAHFTTENFNTLFNI